MSLEKLSFSKMEPFQQCALELALRFFLNRERLLSHCSSFGEIRLDDFQVTDWMAVFGLHWSTASTWLVCSTQPYRTVLHISCDLFSFLYFFLFMTVSFVVLYRMNPGFAKYRDLFDVPSTRFLWYSESSHDIFFPEGPIHFDEDLEFPAINRFQLDE